MIRYLWMIGMFVTYGGIYRCVVKLVDIGAQAHVRACVCMCMYACVRAQVYVCAQCTFMYAYASFLG